MMLFESQFSLVVFCIFILGKENEYKEIFNSKRMKPVKNRWEVKNRGLNPALIIYVDDSTNKIVEIYSEKPI